MQHLSVGLRNIARIEVDYDSVKTVDGRVYLPSEIVEAVLRVVRQHAEVASARIYVAMGFKNMGTPIPQSQIYEVYRRGATLVPVPSYAEGKNGLKSLVDPTLITELAFDLGRDEPFGTVVIVTSDKDFLPPVRKAIECGKTVWLFYGERPATCLLNELKESPSSKVIDLAELLRNGHDETGEANGTALPPGA